MTGRPFKVHAPDGSLEATTAHAELAAAVAGMMGPGSRVKCFGRIVWREGTEETSAADSVDAAAATMLDRIEAAQ